MTSTPTPGSHPHTDPDAELPETVAVHIEWLRRPRSVSNDVDAYRADNRQSADHLSRLLAVAHRLAERAETAETEAADARLDAEGWERTARAAESLVEASKEVDRRTMDLLAEATADRDRLATRVETLEGAARALPASYPHAAYYLWRQTGDSRAADRCQAFDDAYAALRALVAPDTPTSPTDTGAPT